MIEIARMVDTLGRVPMIVATLLVGCAEERPTAVVVRISTDLHIPAEVDGLTIEVSRASYRFERSYALGTDDAIDLPGTLTIAAENDFSIPLTIRLTGTLKDRRVVQQVARLPLIEHKVLVLQMHLARACVAPSEPCAEDETCSLQGCRPIIVDPEELSEFDPGATYDASAPPDAGVSDLSDGDLGGASVDARPIPDGWVLVPGGSFKMGSPLNEPCREGQGKETLHDVALTLGFVISSTEVTQAQFAQLFTEHEAAHAGCPSCPVDKVTWHQAAMYCNELSARDSLALCYECDTPLLGCDVAPAYRAHGVNLCPGYRLPTEAEWEHAYRAGTQSALYNGSVSACAGADATVNEIAWYAANTSATSAVGQKSPNRWGLYDMAGNVAEWCHDWYLPDLGESAVTNPIGPISHGATERAVRGGAWSTDAGSQRAATRGKAPAGQASDAMGFRCVRSVVERCGNGTVDPGEQCDGKKIPTSCAQLGYEGGALACDAACALDSRGCYKCGDGKINGLEQCDGTELGGVDCAKLGFTGGQLKCKSCFFDDSECT